MLRKLRKFILPEKDIIKYITHNAQVLDIGCGENGLSNRIDLEKINSYTGIDIKIKNKKISFKVKIYNSEWRDVIKDIKNYDTIIIIDVLHHIAVHNQKNLIEDTIKNLKRNSTLIYKDIANKNKFYGFMNRLHDFVYNFQIINYYDSDNIINIIKYDKNYSYTYFKKRIYWYDHEFIIIKKL